MTGFQVICLASLLTTVFSSASLQKIASTNHDGSNSYKDEKLLKSKFETILIKKYSNNSNKMRFLT